MFSRRTLVSLTVASGLAAAACASYAPPRGPAYTLAGTRWTAESINGQPVAGAAPQIAFGAEYRLTGTGGCNRLSGVYETAGDRIAVRGLGRTRMACAAPVMSQEEAFVSILDSANTVTQDGDRLVIAADDGQNVTFEQAPG
ncbi:META domain-containing protein [Terricaulis sp.]|uniref:META domain-containing protein n=1 Tax=Terricaulis sp. TaxID=2768686 RepID=UPI003783A58F